MKSFLALLAGLGLAALPLVPANAQNAAPTPCRGLFVKDASGDQVIGPVNGNFPVGGTPASSKGPDNLDIKGLFFNTVNGVTTANIQVANLSQTVPDEFREGRFSFAVDFANVGDAAWVRAEISEDAVTYHLVKTQSIGGLASANIGNQDLKGNFFPGPDGIVQIEMPADIFKPGMTLENVFAHVSQRTDNNFHAGYINDQAPDDGATAAKKVTLAECPAAPPEGGGEGGTPPADPAPTPQPPSSPGQGIEQPQQSSGQQQPPPGTLPASGQLKVDVAVDKGKRRTAVRRGLRARVRCSVQCKVAAVARVDKRTARKLKLGRKAVRIGLGRATITKAGRIPFYVKLTKKAKKALKRKGVRKFSLKVQFAVTDIEGNQLKRVTKRSTLR